MKTAAGIVVAGGLIWGGAVARAQAQGQDGEIQAPPLSLDLGQPSQDQPSDPIAAKSPRVPFGQAGSRWWTIGAGIADNLEDATDFNLRGAYSYFLVKDVEFSAELNAWYFHQDGPDAGGINPAMVFRWHFYDDQQWTIYADAGVGLLFATDDVPEGGTSFDFTPRIGVGFTRELDPDTGTRLQVGLRWHHVSNARIYGSANNPSRDGVMLYAGDPVPVLVA